MKKTTIKTGKEIRHTKDALGWKIRVGDYITYATTGSGRQPFMKLGRVLEIKKQNKYPGIQVKVAGLEYDTYGYTIDGTFTRELLPQWWYAAQESVLKGSLGNVIKLNVDQVPQQARKMFDALED